jgi:small-conductance mechanosensitive channel
MKLNLWISPATSLAIFVLIGIIIDKWVIGRLSKFASRTRWGAGDQVCNAISGVPTTLFTLIGLRCAVELSPLSARSALFADKAILAGGVLLITWALERSISGMMDVYSSRAQSILPSTTIFNTIIKITIYLTGILVLLHSLGISVTPVVTALGIGGLAVALALKDTLSNLFSGIQVILSQQLNMGDYIRLSSGEEGYIVDITWRNTTIRTLQNSIVIVPNSTLATAVITNYGLPDKEFSFGIPMGIPYESNLDHIESVIKDVVRQLQADFPDKMPVAEPGIRFTGFAESSITLNASLRIREFEYQFEMRHHFIKRVLNRFHHEGIHLAIPTREILHKTVTPLVSGDGLE